MTTIATITAVICIANAAFGLWQHNFDAAAGWACAAVWAGIAA